MSQQLPVPLRNEPRERSLAIPGRQSSASSTLAQLAVSLAPQVLRTVEQVILKRNQQPARRQSTGGSQGHSVHLSEIEIDTSIPFVRRVTVRNATSWSTLPAPQTHPIEVSGRSRGRLIGISGAVVVLAAVMARKVIPTGRIIDIQGRQRD
jgi:hypothetical protein